MAGEECHGTIGNRAGDVLLDQKVTPKGQSVSQELSKGRNEMGLKKPAGMLDYPPKTPGQKAEQVKLGSVPDVYGEGLPCPPGTPDPAQLAGTEPVESWEQRGQRTAVPSHQLTGKRAEAPKGQYLLQGETEAEAPKQGQYHREMNAWEQGAGAKAERLLYSPPLQDPPRTCYSYFEDGHHRYEFGDDQAAVGLVGLVQLAIFPY
jgi:hypothetical protein